MSARGRKPYPYTLADLRKMCPGLATIEVIGFGPDYHGSGPSTPSTEQLIGKNAAGEILIRVKGRVTPGNVEKFKAEYERACTYGIIKRPPPIPIRKVDGPDDPPGRGNR